MREAKTVTVRGTAYTVHDLPATKALQLALELSKFAVTVPDLPDGQALKPGEHPPAGTKFRIDFRLTASALFSNEDVLAPESLIRELLTCVAVPGAGLVDKSSTFEFAFAGGKIADLPELVAQILEQNFADFFIGLAGLLPASQD